MEVGAGVFPASCEDVVDDIELAVAPPPLARIPASTLRAPSGSPASGPSLAAAIPADGPGGGSAASPAPASERPVMLGQVAAMPRA